MNNLRQGDGKEEKTGKPEKKTDRTYCERGRKLKKKTVFLYGGFKEGRKTEECDMWIERTKLAGRGRGERDKRENN